MKANLCKCNSILIDQNPQVNAPMFDKPESAIEMQYFQGLVGNDDSDMFWGCPICETDDFLMDIESSEELESILEINKK